MQTTTNATVNANAQANKQAYKITQAQAQALYTALCSICTNKSAVAAQAVNTKNNNMQACFVMYTQTQASVKAASTAKQQAHMQLVQSTLQANKNVLTQKVFNSIVTHCKANNLFYSKAQKFNAALCKNYTVMCLQRIANNMLV